MMRLALSLTSQPADAEDLVQDTLVRAYRSIDKFDGAHPRAWLFTIMRHAHANNHRRRRPVLLRDEDVLESRQDEDAGPEETIVGEQFSNGVQHAFDALPDAHQEVIRLIDIAGLTYAEAAHVLGIPTGTVMSRLHRARAAIRRELQSAHRILQPETR